MQRGTGQPRVRARTANQQHSGDVVALRKGSDISGSFGNRRESFPGENEKEKSMTLLRGRPFIELNALTTAPCNWQRKRDRNFSRISSDPFSLAGCRSMEYFIRTGNPVIRFRWDLNVWSSRRIAGIRSIFYRRAVRTRFVSGLRSILSRNSRRMDTPHCSEDEAPKIGR